MNSLRVLPLTFCVLRGFARAFEAVFLAFLDPGITGQKTVLAQRGLEAFIGIYQRTGNAVLDGARLAGDAAADNPDLDVIFAGGVRNDEGLLYHTPVVYQWKDLLIRLPIDHDFT